MATNQQLKDYITQQTKLGVSKETMKSALLGAGWNEGDVNQAMAEYETESKVAASPAAAQPASAVQPSVQPAAQPQTSFSSSAAFSAPATKPSTPLSTPFMTSDIFQPKGEAVFKPSSASQSALAVQKPETISMSMGSPAKGKLDILAIGLGVLCVILLGGNVYFYFQNGGLRSQIGSSAVAPDAAAVQQQASQLAALTSDKTNLTQQVDVLNKTIMDLTNQISIFEPAASSSIVSVPFDVSGMVGGGGKLLYSLTTSKNIILTVKNSKDTDIDAVLKLLVGKQAELAGNHQPGSVQLTVTTINGKTPKDTLTALTAPAAATSTAPATTSTSPVAPTAATSTPAPVAATSTPAGPGPAPAPLSSPAIPTATTTATSTP